jgi:hypothetical protein
MHYRPYAYVCDVSCAVSDDIYVISLFVLTENKKTKKQQFFFFGLCRVPWHLHSAKLANMSLCFPAGAIALSKDFFKKIKKDSLPSAG